MKSDQDEFQQPIPEEVTDTVVDVGLIRSTEKTAKIRLVSTEIERVKTKHGQDTNLLIVAVCKLDNNEYACLYDMVGKRGFTVGVERKNGQVIGFHDLDRFDQDEEWATITDFFNKNNVLERNRIFTWIWNSKINPRLNTELPHDILRRWGIDPTKLRDG